MPRAYTADERERIRTALRAAARAEAARLGLHRVPVEELARAAGISKGAFYLFYPSKEALVLELLLHTEATLRAAMRAALEAPRQRRLHAVLAAMFDGVAADPMLWVLTDPASFAWLARSVPPDQLATARADDDRFAGEVFEALRLEGCLAADADADVFAGLGGVATAITAQAGLIGPTRVATVRALLVDALALRLGRSGSSAGPGQR